MLNIFAIVINIFGRIANTIYNTILREGNLKKENFIKKVEFSCILSDFCHVCAPKSSK